MVPVIISNTNMAVRDYGEIYRTAISVVGGIVSCSDNYSSHVEDQANIILVLTSEYLAGFMIYWSL